MTFTLPDLNVPSNYDSYLVMEKYTGASFILQEQIMINAELKPDVLYPNLSLSSLQSTGYRTYMPSFFMYKDFGYDNKQLDDNFGQIKTVMAIHLWIQVVGYTLGGLILLVVTAVHLYYYCKRRRQMQRAKLAENSESTILFLNHQSTETRPSEELQSTSS